MKIINVDDYRKNGIFYFGDLVRDIMIWNRIEMSKDTYFYVPDYIMEIFSIPVYQRSEDEGR